MNFMVAKPSKNMSFGELFFSRPDCGESAIWFNDFEAFCRKKAKEEFGNNKETLERLEAELDMIAQTNSALTFEIVAEIAKLSKKNGYPVCLFGEESGLLVMYLLGVSGIHPGQYEFNRLPTDVYLMHVLEKDCVSITLAIAEPIRELICPCLKKEFASIGCSNEDYINIHLPSFEALEKIGMLSKETARPYSEIYLESPNLLFEVWCELFEKDLVSPWEFTEIAPETALEIATEYCAEKLKNNANPVACLSRINAMIMLKYYNQEFPEIYNKYEKQTEELL